MLDRVLVDIVNDIALEGENGCSFDQFLEHIQEAIERSLSKIRLPKPMQFDTAYKSFLWNKVKNNHQLVFTEKNDSIDATSLPYDKISTIAADISVKALDKIQDQILYGHLKSEKKNLSEQCRDVLSIVAKRKEKGITQLELAELLQANHKTTYIHVRKLCQHGLICKEKVYKQKRATNILYHWRFAGSQTQTSSTSTEPGSLYRIEKLKDDVIEKLRQADNNMMSLQDLVRSLGIVGKQPGKWARSKIAIMHDEGHIEKFIAYDGTYKVPSVRLPPTHSEKERMKLPNTIKENDNASSTSRENRYGLLRDLPFEYVVYQDIVRSGGKGFSKVDFVETYPYIDSALFKFLCDTVFEVSNETSQQKYPLYCTEEIGGKVKQYRYYSEDGWKEAQSHSRSSLTENQTAKDMNVTNSEQDMTERDKPVEQKAQDRSQQSKRPRSNSISSNHGASNIIDNAPKKPRKSKTSATHKELDQADNRNIPASPCNDGSQTTPTSSTGLDAIQSDQKKRKLDEIEEPLLRPSSKTARRTKATIQNNTRTRRRNLILDMLEKQPILELSHELYTRFVELEAAAANGQGIARKTFYSLVKQLHEENRLKYYVTAIETSFGIIEQKTFLLHPSLSENDAQVQQHIDQLKKITLSAPKRREFQTVTVDEVPTTKEADALTSKLSPSTNHGVQKQPKTSTDAIVISGTEAYALNTSLRDRTWSMKATEYGYSASRWHRARILHEAMFSHCLLENPVNNVIVMNDILKQMPLKTLMQLYGVLPYENQTLLAFLGTKSNFNTALYQLPRNIKVILSEAVKKFRFAVIRLLRILKALALIETVQDENLEGSNIPLKIALLKNGIVRDYTKNERPIVMEISLQDMTDVHTYWARLQMHCTDHLDDIVVDSDKDDPLSGITNRRSWSFNTILNDDQKAILDSFVDFEAKTVPDENNGILRSHIMRLTKLSWKRVKKYYNAMLVSFKKYEAKKVRTDKLKRIPRTSSSAIVNDLMRASYKKKKIDLPRPNSQETTVFREPTFIGSRKFKNLRLIVEPHSRFTSDSRGNRRSLDPFTSIEKDILIHAYCIMKTRAEMSIFYWSPISQVISNHEPERCRRKLNTLIVRRPQLSSTIEQLKAKWKVYYREGLEKQEIEDASPWDTVNYDLSSYLEYFLRRLKEEESISKTIQLPLDVLQLRRCYFVLQKDMPVHQPQPRLSSISAKRFDEQAYDTQAILPAYNKTEVSKQLVTTLIKMNFMTLDEHYSRKDAYKLLSAFPEDIVQETLDELKSKELIVNDKSRYGRIPGRRINVSERFMNLATSVFPVKMLEEAHHFYQDFVSQGEHQLGSALLDSGSMAALLSLLSQGKLDIDVLNRELFLQSRKVLYYPKLTSTQLESAFVFREFDLRIRLKPNQNDVDNQDDVCTSDYGALNTTLTIGDVKNCCATPSISKDRCAQLVYKVIHSFGERGASWSDILSKVNTDCERIREALHLLLESEPAAVQIVGFGNLRYVATPFTTNWLINDTANKRWIYPVMWHDATGKLITPALEGTAEVVLSHIMVKPGITFASLRLKLRGLLSDFELYRILKYLEDHGRITAKKIRCASVPRKSSIFDKRYITAVSSGRGLNNDEITHYWLTPNYYMLKA